MFGLLGRKMVPMIKKAAASGAAGKAVSKVRGIGGMLQEVATATAKKPPVAAPRGRGLAGAVAEAAKKAVGKGRPFKKGGAVKKSSDAMGRAVKRKTADVKGRAMKKGK